MADVKVPLLGKVPKGGLFAGGLAVVGVAGYLWYKHQKNMATVATPATSATAYGYGSPAAYGYGLQAGYGYGYGPYGYGFGQYGATGGYPGSITSPYGYGIAAPQNNAQWTQNATAQLVNQGYTGPAVLAALGAYLSGRPIQQGSSEDTTIQAAIALEGYPPQPGAGGFPPGINYQGTNPGQGQQVTVPNIVGLDLDRAMTLLDEQGLKHANWSTKHPQSFRIVTAQNPSANSKVKSGTFVHITYKLSRTGPTAGSRS